MGYMSWKFQPGTMKLECANLCQLSQHFTIKLLKSGYIEHHIYHIYRGCRDNSSSTKWRRTHGVHVLEISAWNNETGMCQLMPTFTTFY